MNNNMINKIARINIDDDELSYIRPNVWCLDGLQLDLFSYSFHKTHETILIYL